MPAHAAPGTESKSSSAEGTAKSPKQGTSKETSNSVFELIGREVNAIYESNRESLVRVRCSTVFGIFSGTGFFIDEKGTVLTSSSLITNPDETWIELNGERIRCRIKGIDRRTSLALLETDLRGVPIRFAPASPKAPGTAAIVLGFPYNQPIAPAFGLISGFDTQSPEKKFFCTAHIRADINLTQGLVGGPMFNTAGEVIGIVTGSLDEGRNCYALPVEALKRVVKDLRAFGYARTGWVGIAIRQTEAYDVEGRSVLVDRIFTNSPAANTDIALGDKVLRINGHEIYTPSDVVTASFLVEPGQKVAIDVNRQGKKRSIQLTVAERPEPQKVSPEEEIKNRKLAQPADKPGPQGPNRRDTAHEELSSMPVKVELPAKP